MAELFTTDKYADDVRFDFEEARALGITGVPFFVIDRKFGLSGAQPAETFTAALNQAWQETNPLVLVNAARRRSLRPGRLRRLDPQVCPVTSSDGLRDYLDKHRFTDTSR